ncbi:hypothetical protein F2Q70_00040638 [Brassica cretica]|uniref:Uncharacterized protein n=1 Tax=Brassica cretica TaxID=69181 RepID=A0A8S9K2T5_BRACR|nr:hypothetical protein F2Q70_00040638 [Brassica cretica]
MRRYSHLSGTLIASMDGSPSHAENPLEHFRRCMRNMGPVGMCRGQMVQFLFTRMFQVDAYIGTEDGWAVGNGPDEYVQAEDHVNDTQTEGDDQESFFFLKLKTLGEAMGSDKESAICRVRQLSNIEYNSPFYWDVVSLIENSETARQMVLGLSDDEHVLNYLKRSIQVQKEPPCYTDFSYFDE